MGKQWIHMMTLTIVFFVYSKGAAAFDTRYIIPNGLNNTVSDAGSCPANYECHTLNEWIENGTSPFTNGTTVVLLPGRHLIKSKTNSLVTRNNYTADSVYSIVFTGQQGYSSVEYFHHFRFEFVDIHDIVVTQVTFRSCSLMMTLTDFSLPFINLTLQSIERGIIAIPEITFMLNEINVISGHIGVHNAIVTDLITPAFPAIVNILNSNFQGTSIQVTSSWKGIRRLSMEGVLVKGFMSSLVALYVDSVYEVSLADIIFWNNTSPLITMNQIDFVEFKGHCKFLYNNGEWGVYISNGRQISLSPQSKLKYFHNNVKYNVFHILRFALIDWITSIIHMKNNTIESDGILVINGPTYSFTINQSNIVCEHNRGCLLYTSPSPRDATLSRMPSSA